jgi:hypothetical protein
MVVAALMFATALAADTSYFQQRVAYRIEARLDETSETLAGRLRLHYENRSPARIDTLWFHLHLNAFRPNSKWAQRELEYGERRFTDLGPRDHAFERVRRIAVGGTAVRPVYPGAPDSTVIGVPLPQPLAAGGSVTVDMDWDARPSTLPRRQGRRGRHYDFAQWYPRIAVYDRGGWQVQPLLPQGEFYGEFGSYDVTLEVARDQVIGATGVPVEGDPGWAGAAATPRDSVDYRRAAYAPAPAVALGLLTGAPPQRAKRVRWRAEDVHHFAWTTSPEYIYEGGAYQSTGVHVLYRPGDETEWADGAAVQRTVRALEFYDRVFGPFPWPQLTNVHRIEGGGTEFPMMVMDGGASEGLILHEVGHNYVHGILANNEWREGWLDEGFVSFLTNWALEERGAPVNWARDLDAIRQLEQRHLTQPIALASAEFRDPATYGAMTYTKPSLVFRMLRWVMGEDAFRAALRQYYADNRLQHVTEADLRAAVNAHARTSLDWFFDQWIHTTHTLDYGIGEVATTRTADGQWQTRIEVVRDGEMWMPIELLVDGVGQRLESRERRQVVTISSATRPAEVQLDPQAILLDIDDANNRKRIPQ